MVTKTRWIRGAALLSVGAVALTACGGNSGGGEDGDVTLQFTWWGSDVRHENTEEIIAAFEEENPGITVEGEYGAWSGYWDRLATQAAGGDAPDIIQMDEQYIREYSDRNALLDLSDVDTSSFADAAVEGGRTDDGLVAVSLGVVSLATMANVEVFEEAGVEVPDDSTWTWEDYAEASQKVTEATGKDIYGAGPQGEPMGLQIWLRQQGEELFTEDGELALTKDKAHEYLDFTGRLRQDGGFPSADYISETRELGPDNSPFGSNEMAMGTAWATQLTTLAKASGSELQPLHLPSFAGDFSENGAWIKGSMFLSASAETEHPEAAKKFIEFFVNSKEAGEINGMERGLPANLDVREMVLEDVSGPEQKAADFIAEVEQQVDDTVPVPPPGFSDFMGIITRHETEVLFGRTTTEEAAGEMVEELKSTLE
ncbi:ABC transporter substrate-binding protein [Nesterenkonia halobia]|uniref:Extracellular solute-binding protein n=1 Tax=Nesterenkonia halobia TaxID=37922 RepID=A0ABP6REQ8_9MICC